MPYNITRIQKYTSTSGVFFFDTNIWIEILSPRIGKEMSRASKGYVNFFERVIREGGKIAVNKLLISELVNTYMYRVAVKAYEREFNTEVPKIEFKTKYRPTQHYKDQYEIICDDIFSRSENFEYVDFPDEYIDIEEAVTLSQLDFNDYCFYKTIQKHGIKLVTNDFDFFLQDIEVLTLNQKLFDEQYIRNNKKK